MPKSELKAARLGPWVWVGMVSPSNVLAILLVLLMGLGMEVDVCRALAAVILGSPERVQFVPVEYVQHFVDDAHVDVVLHGLTHALNAVMSAIVEAEERGITSADAADGVGPERLAKFVEWAAPFMPDLPADWAVRVVRLVGNYGEIYRRNLAKASAYGIERGLNQPWNAGGIMYALPVR